MTTRRTFLRLLGIGAPAAAVATPVWPCRAVTRKQLQAEYPNPVTAAPSEVNYLGRYHASSLRYYDEPRYSDIRTPEQIAEQLRDDIEWTALRSDERGKSRLI